MTCLYRTAAIWTAIGLLAGCAGHVNDSDDAALVTIQSAQVRLNTCVSEAYDNPELEPLWNKLPMNVRQVSMDELQNDTFATDPEIELLREYDANVQTCLKSFLGEVTPVAPTIASLMADAYGDIRASFGDLMQRKLSWGSYLKSALETYDQLSPRLAAEIRRLSAPVQAPE